MSITTVPVASVAEFSVSTSLGGTTSSETDSAATPLVREASTAPPSPVAKDLSDLLTDLASGNIRKSSEDLLKLKQDLKAQHALQGSDADVSQGHAGSLEKVVSAVSSALKAGSTEEALAGLSTYLVESGQSSGTAVKTSV